MSARIIDGKAAAAELRADVAMGRRAGRQWSSADRRWSGSLCGDVDTDAVAAVASAVTPVPGGVGPMTIAMLLRNTVLAARLLEGAPTAGR